MLSQLGILGFASASERITPLLFNIYSEDPFRETLSESRGGIVMNGEVINNLRYADDRVLIVDNAEGVPGLRDRPFQEYLRKL